jgi:hypothetical protein
MLGALILAVVILVVLPVTVMLSLGVVAALLGWALKDNGEATHEGSELIDLNV